MYYNADDVNKYMNVICKKKHLCYFYSLQTSPNQNNYNYDKNKHLNSIFLKALRIPIINTLYAFIWNFIMLLLV